LPNPFCPNPLAFPQENSRKAVGGQRRGEAQDQDQGTVVDLYHYCKLIQLEINKEYFSHPNA
jgi:hypothetical protein